MRLRPDTLKHGVGMVLLVCAIASQSGCDALRNSRGMKITYNYVKTDDGITLALRHYKPDHIPPDRDPVILCHGLSYNLLFWDLADRTSLARHLANEGFDVWSLSLRGAYPSSQPLNSTLRKMSRLNLEPEMLKTLQKRLGDIRITNWSVDDHINHDVPTAIKYVQKQTEHKRVHWVGHSMGGMVMFAYLQDPAQARNIHSFAAVSVPMAVFHPLSEPLAFMLDSEDALKIGSKVVGSSAPAAVGTIFGDMGLPMDRLFYNSNNIDGSILRGLFYLAQEEISAGQLQQLLAMVRSERFTSIDTQTDYTAGLAEVTTPTYFLVGTVDNLATLGAVQYAFRQINSTQKEFDLFGRVNGHKHDYGHDDIIIGKQAKSEVYPRIVAWLDRFPCRPNESDLMLQPAGTQQIANQPAVVQPTPDKEN